MTFPVQGETQTIVIQLWFGWRTRTVTLVEIWVGFSGSILVCTFAIRAETNYQQSWTHKHFHLPFCFVELDRHWVTNAVDLKNGHAKWNSVQDRTLLAHKQENKSDRKWKTMRLRCTKCIKYIKRTTPSISESVWPPFLPKCWKCAAC